MSEILPHMARHMLQFCHVVARSLHLQPGDEILTTDYRYGALDL
jgi:hypothetical protein